jgi:hypothetical protein
MLPLVFFIFGFLMVIYEYKSDVMLVGEGDTRCKDTAGNRLFPKLKVGRANRSITFLVPEIEIGFLKQRLWHY